MFEESTPNADESATAGSAPSDSAPSWHPNGTGGDANGSETKAVDTSPTDLVEPDDNTAFLAELAQAMKSTVAVERTRITQDTDRRREAHIARINERRETESAKMRDLAQDDLKGIDAWAERERQRIQGERERRAAAVRRDLESSLSEHRAKIDGEIDSVDSAIAIYRSEVEAFFVSLDGETDPVAIAQHAGRRPVFPSLDPVGQPEEAPTTSVPAAGITPPSADATTAIVEPVAVEAPASPAPSPMPAPVAQSTEPAPEAVPVAVSDAAPVASAESSAAADPAPDQEPAEALGSMVGVMDPGKSTTKLAQAWAAWQASTQAADEARAAQDAAAGIDPADDSAFEGAEPDAVAAGAYKPAADSATRAGGSGGPMSWLRRDKDHNGS